MLLYSYHRPIIRTLKISVTPPLVLKPAAHSLVFVFVSLVEQSTTKKDFNLQLGCISLVGRASAQLS